MKLLFQHPGRVVVSLWNNIFSRHGTYLQGTYSLTGNREKNITNPALLCKFVKKEKVVKIRKHTEWAGGPDTGNNKRVSERLASEQGIGYMKRKKMEGVGKRIF